MTTQETLFTYTLRLADNALVLGQRLSEWTGHGPFLEEDLALTNIALDTFGTATSLLEYGAKVENKGRDADALAYRRNEREFTNVLLMEQANGDYAKTIMRQVFVDAYNVLLYSELSKSKDETLAGIAQKAIKEVSYHYRHSSAWVIRFGDGTEESHNKIQEALNELWRFTGELFELDEVENDLVKQGIAVDVKAFQSKWEKQIDELLTKATLKKPETVFMQSGGRKGIHTEHLGYMLSEMQTLPRMLPDAKW
jgi:ring-1,2-phenylacetyl-CoA epoxidase subunit PaaC